MKYSEIKGTAESPDDIKSVGDELVLDGVKHIVDAIETYHETWDGLDIHRFEYKLKPVEVIEKTIEELQNL